ncbi:FMP52 [[Candida] subhashii]|uniref:FMP52 n=1 Tax=[Candida] subhashii TaxID=561895 RepID=A0A8J5V5J0_9ASCO|nr:FMP52 [[Candida] subhashii]KAG7666079.1 FMP52 [[Candida] subhashii]
MSSIVLGSTGLVGGQIVKVAKQSTTLEKLITITRRPLPSEETEDSSSATSKVISIVESDSSKWPNLITEQTKTGPIDVFITALGTTRAKAGSAEKFKEIDYGINYDNAKSAKENGVKTLILVSSGGANPDSRFLYFQTKGQLEKDIEALEFDRTVILRPGVLLGERENYHGFGTSAATFVGRLIKGTFMASLMRPIEGHEVATVAIDFAEKAIKGELKDKVTIIEPADLVKLANTLSGK